MNVVDSLQMTVDQSISIGDPLTDSGVGGIRFDGVEYLPILKVIWVRSLS